ncbi:MAG: HypC/HybG/HupF family hydrogenase formation chaperone [Candidatus Hydrothermarchaeales archaeon]
MCLAIPAEVIGVHGDHATVDFGGARSEVNISLIEEVKVGEYVIVHVGYGIQKMSREEAQESLELWEELLQKEY